MQRLSHMTTNMSYNHIGSVAFSTLTSSEPARVAEALEKLIQEFGLGVEWGYVARLWQENAELCFSHYFGNWHEDKHQPAIAAFDSYYRRDSDGKYGFRRFPDESTLLKTLLDRDHPLRPHSVPEFFEAAKQGEIAGDLVQALSNNGITSFGPAYFFPFVSKKGHYFLVMLKLPATLADKLPERISQTDLLASLVGFATFSIGIKPLVKHGSEEDVLFKWIEETLKTMITGMHDTVAHTFRVSSIVQKLSFHLLDRGGTPLTEAAILPLRAAALVHDFGKHHSLTAGKKTLQSLEKEIRECAEECAKARGQDAHEKKLKKLRKLFKERKPLQKKYDEHPVQTTREVYEKFKSGSFTKLSNDPNWTKWLIPVLCHHLLKEGGSISEDSIEGAQDYLSSLHLEALTVKALYEDLAESDQLLVRLLALADTIEDQAGFKVARQTSMSPDEAITDISTHKKYEHVFGEELIGALRECDTAIRSVYFRGVEL